MIALQTGIETAKSAVANGSYDQAIAWCQHILRRYPRAVEAHWLLAEAYREKGKLDDAESLCLRVLSATPDNTIARWGLALIAEEHNDLQEAVWHLVRALEYNPGHAELEGELVRISGRPSELTPGGLASIYMRGGLYERASDQFRAALAVEGNHLEYEVGLLEALWCGRHHSEADELARRILEDSPDCLKANVIAGLVRLLWPGWAALAEPYLVRARQIDPLDTTLRSLIRQAGLTDQLQVAPIEALLPPLSADDQSQAAAPATVGSASRWLEESRPLPLDWLTGSVESVTETAQKMTAAASGELVAAGEPAASASQVSEADGDLWGDLDLPEEGVLAGADAPPMESPAESWRAVAEDVAAAAGSSPTTLPPDAPSSAFPTPDEVRSSFGEEWADLLAEDVSLDAEAERRLSEAISDLVGPDDETAEADWQVAKPGTIARRQHGPEAPADAPAEAPFAATNDLDEEADLEVSDDLDLAPAMPEEPIVEAVDEAELPEESQTAALDSEIVEPLLKRLEERPDDHASRLALAAAYQQGGEADLAALEYRRLIREAPQLVQQIVENLKWLTYTQPQCASAHRALGDAYMKMGLFQQAIEEYNSVLNHR